jgi:zinc D-Ala-D-Ala dipeptidase
MVMRYGILPIVLAVFSSGFFMHSHQAFCLPPQISERGFVYFHEVDPTIRISLRYAGKENFIGKPIAGYKKPVCILTKQAAYALKKVQEEIQKDGYALVVYDAYRPQKAVNAFIEWAQDPHDQSKKPYYYPRVDKSHVFQLGYIAKKSGHSRGSTVDLTIIRVGNEVHDIKEKKRVLKDGYTITFLDDGTVDMGSSFDLFDEASHPESILIEESHAAMRRYLQKIMEKHGFTISSTEWWHFTLRDEPFPAHKETSYFDFDIG